MKRAILISLLAFAMFVVGCDNPNWHCCHEDDYYYEEDYTPPPVPNGVYSVTGDESVRLYWNPVCAYDFAGYRVWRGYSETGYYYLIGETPSAYFVDWDVSNGNTYYYAVSAYDTWGNESALSDELVFDTPRPEGYGERVYTVEGYPNDAGYDFSCYCVVPYDDEYADVFFGYDDSSDTYYMQSTGTDTDLLIYGPTTDLTDVDWAPETGWLSGGSVDLYEGYSYLVWTWDNHFAQVRITCLCGDYIKFDWSYQTDEGNPELRVGKDSNHYKVDSKDSKKKEHTIEITHNVKS